MNFKTQILAVAAALLLASASGVDAAPAKAGRKGARKNVLPFVPETPLRHTRIVGASVEPIAEPQVAAGAFAGESVKTNPLQAALDFAHSRFLDQGIQQRNYVVSDSYTTDHNGITHVYLRQVVNGLEVYNADMNINVQADGSILSAADSFFAGESFPEIPTAAASAFSFKKPMLSALEALQHFGNFIGEETVTKGLFAAATTVEEVKLDDNMALIRNVPYAEADVPARLVYIQTEAGDLKLGWELTVQMTNNWFSTVVDATSGDLISVIDWTSQALPSYRVLPFGTEDPDHGKVEIVTVSAEPGSSPLGWHDDGATKYTTTIGNNVDAKNLDSNSKTRRPEGTASLQFHPDVDFSQEPRQYYEAATVQLFYLSNRYHDLLYQLGFNEVAGNFQTNNLGKGGKGDDPVLAFALDPYGSDNASFTTPKDGVQPWMHMYIFTKTKPYRDGDFQSTIVMHELTHGLSNRLTGGPSNVNCLPSGEAGGMGEGWGDAIGTVVSMTESNTRDEKYPCAPWAYGSATGIRKYPYSTDLAVDPETYGYIKKSGYSEVHKSGEVWAGILLEVYWNLREARGFQADLFKVDVTTAEARANAKGNVIFLLNVVDGMKLQPCKPKFTDARDAILAADKANFGGANTCLMWKGFAKRGLGVKAKSGGTEDFSIPAECN